MFDLRLGKIRKKIIGPDEKIILEFCVAKKYSNFWLILGLIILLISLVFIRDLFILILLAISLFGYSFYLKTAYYYFLTDKKIIFYYQFFSSYFISVDYHKITDLNVRENFFEKTLLQSGDLAVNTAGGPKEEITFNHVASSYLIKKQIDELKIKI
ncbi:MAG: PH domain-containing protein [Ignavibacterium sp.]|nr:PH domain-containing protein [Ignavibacterium sp.]